MFNRKKRDDTADFHSFDVGQLFALFKHLGGKTGVQKVLNGLPAPTAAIPDKEIRDTWMTVTVKIGSEVIAGFHTAYLAEQKKNKGNVNPLDQWRTKTAADSNLDEMSVDLCLVEARTLTGFDKDLPRSVLFRTIRHPYQVLPIEILAQLPTFFDELSDDKWDTFAQMYAQPTLHDAAGGYDKQFILNGSPLSKLLWSTKLEQWKRSTHGPVVQDPVIWASTRLLVMKLKHDLIIPSD